MSDRRKSGGPLGWAAAETLKAEGPIRICNGDADGEVTSGWMQSAGQL